MKIVLATVGTRGDLQPLLALATALRARGHACFFCAPENFAAWVQVLGFHFAACCRDRRVLLEYGGGFRMLCQISEDAPQMFDVLREAVRGADALVHAMMELAAPSVAEAEGLPLFNVIYAPTLLQSDEHLPIVGLVGRWRAPRWINALAWVPGRAAWNRALREAVNRERARLGLAAIRDVHHYLFHSGHVLLAADPTLAPAPTIPGQRLTVTGFWHLPQESTLAADVEAFLAAGPPPVYLGFGSMVSKNPAQLTATVLKAVRASGQRALISTGWASLGQGDLPANCRAIGAVSHAALFPRLAAVAHHGGAGTFAAAARAGVPQVIVPHLGDQNYWGQRAYRLGLGPKPIFLPFLRAGVLAEALRTAATDPARRHAAQAVAAQLQSHEGVAEAVKVIERTTG